MQRRQFIALSAAALVATPAAAIEGFTDYTPGMIPSLLDQGKTVFVGYSTDWCSTCAKQERVIESLLQDNPDYQKNIAFVRVDWDRYSRDEVSTARKIPRRSTLIALKGDQELGRIVAQTSHSGIKKLLDTALAASGQS